MNYLIIVRFVYIKKCKWFVYFTLGVLYKYKWAPYDSHCTTMIIYFPVSSLNCCDSNPTLVWVCHLVDLCCGSLDFFCFMYCRYQTQGTYLSSQAGNRPLQLFGSNEADHLHHYWAWYWGKVQQKCFLVHVV